MAERPLVTLARLVGGVVLQQGRLGHQVLGQLLLANNSDLAIAGAFVVVAAASKSRNTVLKTVLQTAAPAAAIHSLFSRRAEQLQRREQRLNEQERRWQEDRRQIQVQLREIEEVSVRCRRDRIQLLRQMREWQRVQRRAVTTPVRRRRPAGSAPGTP